MNVLEVMDESAELHMDNLDPVAAKAMRKARAIVAELIEVFREAIDYLESDPSMDEAGAGGYALRLADRCKSALAKASP